MTMRGDVSVILGLQRRSHVLHGRKSSLEKDCVSLTISCETFLCNDYASYLSVPESHSLHSIVLESLSGQRVNLSANPTLCPTQGVTQHLTMSYSFTTIHIILFDSLQSMFVRYDMYAVKI